MDVPGGTSLDEGVAAEARLAPLLPPSIRPHFDGAFVRSYRLYEEYIYRLVLSVAREAGLEGLLREPVDAAQLIARAELEPERARVPLTWMLDFLAAHGALSAEPGHAGRRYQAPAALPALDAGAVRAQQMAIDPSWAPSYALAETAARDYPAFLRGQTTGEDVLFSARRLRMWVDYFSNDNGLYTVNNRVGAAAVEEWLPRAGAVVLELGGGLGSGALALIDRLAQSGRLGEISHYRFTELVPAFLRRGEQALRTRQPGPAALSFGILDMNRPFEEQGVAPRSATVVYAVNTLHAARDLGFTLGEIRGALEPGGRLVVSECIRPRAGQPVATEMIFNLTETFRSPRLNADYRPHGGFLAPEHWTRALEATGFADARVMPDVARIREEVPEWSVAAIGGTRPV